MLIKKMIYILPVKIIIRTGIKKNKKNSNISKNTFFIKTSESKTS